MNVQEYYQHALQKRGFKADAAQLRAVDRLQRAMTSGWPTRRALEHLQALINRPAVPKGVYMWGGVGRGKSS
jgi:cell division protein ZapE